MPEVTCLTCSVRQVVLGEIPMHPQNMGLKEADPYLNQSALVYTGRYSCILLHASLKSQLRFGPSCKSLI